MSRKKASVWILESAKYAIWWDRPQEARQLLMRVAEREVIEYKEEKINGQGR
jgi:hypothetical protein